MALTLENLWRLAPSNDTTTCRPIRREGTGAVSYSSPTGWANHFQNHAVSDQKLEFTSLMLISELRFFKIRTPPKISHPFFKSLCTGLSCLAGDTVMFQLFVRTPSRSVERKSISSTVSDCYIHTCDVSLSRSFSRYCTRSCLTTMAGVGVAHKLLKNKK